MSTAIRPCRLPEPAEVPRLASNSFTPDPWLAVESEKVGAPPRRGEVIAVSGTLLTIRWETGQQSTFVPSAGSLSVEQGAHPTLGQ